MNIQKPAGLLGSNKLTIAILFLLGVCSFHFFVALPYIRNMSDLPLVPDMMHSILPFSPSAGFMADFLVLLSLVMLMIEWWFDKDKWAYGIFVFTFIILIRSICVCLNPLMPPLGVTDFLTYASHASEPGMFFSGHVAFAFIAFLMSHYFRRFKLLLILAVAAGLLLSRAHYSIDIVGGLAIAWACYCFCERYVKRLFINPILYFRDHHHIF